MKGIEQALRYWEGQGTAWSVLAVAFYPPGGISVGAPAWGQHPSTPLSSFIACHLDTAPLPHFPTFLRLQVRFHYSNASQMVC